MRLLYEFDFMAGHSELHDTLVQQMYLRQTATYRAIFEEGNATGAFAITSELAQAAMNMVALEDAYGLHIVAGNRLVTVDMARDAMLAFAGQIGAIHP
ncbi:hypothetical protein [Arthrobacter sp. MMS24-S77]